MRSKQSVPLLSVYACHPSSVESVSISDERKKRKEQVERDLIVSSFEFEVESISKWMQQRHCRSTCSVSSFVAFEFDLA